MRLALALLALSAACGKSASTPPVDESETVLPLVSGCGCAYQCGRLLKTLPDGSVEVTHDLNDSASTPAVIERWCFDGKGHGTPEKGAASPDAKNCRRVYYDKTPCGGECIPSTQYLRCETKTAPAR